MTADFTKSNISKQDNFFESSLRPNYLDEFVGQEKIKKQLKIFIGAAKKRREHLGHVLFSGPPGLGKTTLANIISKTMNTNIITTSGPVLEKPGDLAGILTNLQTNDILFIDEIHRLAKSIEEYLYPAMEEFKLDLLIDSGPNARSVQIKLNKFTLIGATTRSGLISSPMLSRFLFHSRIDYYTPQDLKNIIQRSSFILNIEIDDLAAFEIAKRSRGTPRIANNLLRWTRDFAQMNEIKKINLNCAINSLKMLSIDEDGLDEIDKKILQVIIENHDGGPVGLKTIAAAIGEDESTISCVYEPYLLRNKLIKITARGREATKMAKKYYTKSEKKP